MSLHKDINLSLLSTKSQKNKSIRYSLVTGEPPANLQVLDMKFLFVQVPNIYYHLIPLHVIC